MDDRVRISHRIGATGLHSPRTPAVSRVRATRVLAVMLPATGMVSAAFIIVTAALPLTAAAKTAVFDITELIIAVSAAAACAGASRRTSARDRVGWGLLALAIAVWSFGLAAYAFYNVILGDAVVPFPSIADAGYLGYVPIAVAGAVVFSAGHRTTAYRVRSLLDGLCMAAALLVVSWATVLHTVYEDGPTVSLTNAVALAYPATDIVIVTVMLALAVRAQAGMRLALLLVVGGLCLVGLGDSSFAYVTATGGFTTGGPLDVVWIAGFMLVATGALCAVAHTREGDVDAGRHGLSEPRWALWLPLIPVILAVGACIAEEAVTGHLGWVIVLSLAAIIVFGAARQLLVNTENVELVARFHREATEDSLTGLPNRMSLEEYLEAAAASRGDAGRLAVIFLDVDDFKQVNDASGHAAGDDLLRQVAKRLRGAVRVDEFVARIGGDEFAFVMKRATPVSSQAVAERLLALFALPFTICQSPMSVRCSIGVAVGAPGSDDVAEIVRRADVAMYAAKRRGKGCVEIFHETLPGRGNPFIAES